MHVSGEGRHGGSDLATRRDRGEPEAPRGAGDALAATVGRIFRAAREEQRLSQEQVAALSASRSAGVSRTLISAIERGRSLPGIEALVSLSRVLNIEPREILERVDLSVSVPVDVTGLAPRELVTKGNDSFLSGDYREALAHYDAAADLLVLEGDDSREARELRVRIEINRSVALRRSLALKAAQTAAERAVELAREFAELRTEAYMALASVLSQEGLHVLARDAAERALAEADGADAKHRCQAWAQLGGTLLRARQFEEARRAYLRARELAIRARDLRERNKIEGNIGSCLQELGKRGQAGARFRKAVELARKAGDRSMEASWLVALGRIALAERRLTDAERCAEAALRIVRPLGQRLTVFRAEWLLHGVLVEREPGARDRRRLAHLTRLWRELSHCRQLDDVREFERSVLRRERREDES